jgi:hypothetical protein
LLRLSDQSLQKLCHREGVKERKLHAKNNPIWTNNLFSELSKERLYCGYYSKVPCPLSENRSY